METNTVELLFYMYTCMTPYFYLASIYVCCRV